MVARRFARARPGRPQRRILGEDSLLELAQLGTRFEPELLAEHAASGLERAQCLALATLAILGRHEQRPPVLVDRFGDDERLELGARRVDVLVGVQLELEPPHPRRACHPLQANALGAAELGVGDVVVGTATHQRFRGTQQAPRFGGVVVHVGGRSGEELLESPDVDGVLGHGERVAPIVGPDLRRRDVTSEPRHLGLDRVRRGRTTGPQHLGQSIR